MLARGAVDLLAEQMDQFDVIALGAVGARDLEHARRARVLRFVIGMAEAGDERLARPVARRQPGAPGALVALRGEAFRQDPARPRHRAREPAADHQHPGGKRHLDVVGHRVLDHAGDQGRRRDAVVHQDDQAGIEDARLARRRLAPGDDEVERLGEALLAQNLAEHVLAAHTEARDVRGGAPDAGGGFGHVGGSPGSGRADSLSGARRRAQARRGFAA